MEEIDFEKGNGLVVAVIQDELSGKVLMTGFMNKEAYEKTIQENLVTFYSRSKERLWTKGETSQNYLHVKEMLLDCDRDALLIKVKPDGPTCHTGADTCWNENSKSNSYFIDHLAGIIKDRKKNPNSKSYTSNLLQLGINKVAQKVGEEAVELVIEAMDTNDHLFKEEAADLLFHYLILLEHRNVDISQVIEVLQKRHK